MQKAILEKVTPYLARAPQSECEVVYVLAEVHKFLERDGRQDAFERLNFYCNWALHAEMSRQVAKRVLHEIDEAIATAAEDKWEFFHKFHLEELRKELQGFCASYGLPTNWSSVDWHHFVHHFAGVVQDCPVKIAETPPTTKHIREVKLAACWSREPEKSFQVRWELQFLDATCETVDTVLSPTFTWTLYKGAYRISG